MTSPDDTTNTMTTIGYLAATGTGEARDKHGNLLDKDGNLVAPQEKDDN